MIGVLVHAMSSFIATQHVRYDSFLLHVRQCLTFLKLFFAKRFGFSCYLCDFDYTLQLKFAGKLSRSAYFHEWTGSHGRRHSRRWRCRNTGDLRNSLLLPVHFIHSLFPRFIELGIFFPQAFPFRGDINLPAFNVCNYT